MRGVYEGFKLDDTPHYGSSPRAWGLPLSNAEICCDCRSIPTYVGFTSKNRRTASHRSGPSPHTWGLLLRRKRPLDPGRSIPTYVGFTLEPPLYHSLLAGPSPHTWGLLIDLIYQLLHVRSIPTYVGFTSSESRVTKIPSVHPHIRGVYTEIKSKISRASSKTALLPAEKFKILFLVKIKSSAAAFQVHTIFRDQFPPGLHFEIALHL